MDQDLETAPLAETAPPGSPEPPQADEPDAPVMLTDAMCGCACQVKAPPPLA